MFVQRVRTMLVVDDDPMLAQAMSRMRLVGVEIRVAENSARAFEWLRIAHPELIVVDLFLGSESGVDLVRRIRAQDTSTRIVVASGFMSHRAVVVAMTAGANDVVTKPFSLRNLIDQSDQQEASDEIASLDRFTWEYLMRVVSACGGNISLAARRLGIDRNTLKRRMRTTPA